MISRQSGLRAVLAIAAASVLVTGAIALSPATAESGLSPLEVAQVQRANCQVLLAHATSSAQRTRANNCITDQTAIICVLSVCPSPSPSATQTPSPSPSPTVQPSPSTSPSASTSPAPSPSGDTTPPSVPTGLTSAPRSPTSLLITWTASTGSPTDYLFERGTTQLGVTPSPDWLDTGLTANTTYTYRVRARDAAGNVSAYSAVLTATTPANPPPTPGNQCQANPGACGFPDDATTGATAAAGTTVLNGLQRFTVAGATISNTTINGCTEVRAPNITFRNVVFNLGTCQATGVANFSTGLLVVDSTATCAGQNGTAFGSTSLSLLRVDISGCENGLNVAGTTTVTDSWIHDMNYGQGGAHTDGAQFNEGAADILFQHNTINVGPLNGATSAIIMWDEGGSQNKRVTIANNLMAGGSYTLYCGREGVVDNIRITNNRFGTFQYGYANACNTGEIWTGNVRDSDGAVLAAA